MTRLALAAALLLGAPAAALVAPARAGEGTPVAATCPACGKLMESDWSYCPYDATRLGATASTDVLREASFPAVRQEATRYLGRTAVLGSLKVLSVNQNHRDYADKYKLYVGCDVLVEGKRVDSANLLIPAELSERAGGLAPDSRIRLTGFFRGLDNDYQSSLLIEPTTIEVVPKP